MSRSAFSARFTDVVGTPAMRYVTHGRTQLAHAQLREHPERLSDLSAKLGYASEAAFASRRFEWGFRVAYFARAGAQVEAFFEGVGSDPAVIAI